MTKKAKRWTRDEIGKAEQLREQGLRSADIGRVFGVTGSAIRALLSDAHQNRDRASKPYYLSEFFSGPAIGRCASDDKMKRDAVEGSAKLREALLRLVA